MNFCSIIIENRFNVDQVIADHYRFLPKLNFPIHLNIENIKTIEDYNKLLTSSNFWSGIKEDKVIIFQHDSALLKPITYEFLEWDYVGAPWKFQEHGGNGGLSLRSKEAMLWCIDKQPWNPSLGNEDVYFSNLLKDSPYKLAPREVCEKFSCESIFKLGTIGYHAIDKYLTAEEVHQIKTQYEPNRNY